MAKNSIPSWWVPPCPSNLPDRELIQTVRSIASLPDNNTIGRLTGLAAYNSSRFFKITPSRSIRKLRLSQKHSGHHQTKITERMTISVQRHQSISRKSKDAAPLKAKLVPHKTIKRRPQDTGFARWRLSKKVRRRETIKRCDPYLICWVYRHHGYGLIAEYGETPYLSLLIGFILERTELSTHTQPNLNTAKQRQLEAESPNQIVWRDLMELDNALWAIPLIAGFTSKLVFLHQDGGTQRSMMILRDRFPVRVMPSDKQFNSVNEYDNVRTIEVVEAAKLRCKRLLRNIPEGIDGRNAISNLKDACIQTLENAEKQTPTISGEKPRRIELERFAIEVISLLSALQPMAKNLKRNRPFAKALKILIEHIEDYPVSKRTVTRIYDSAVAVLEHQPTAESMPPDQWIESYLNRRKTAMANHDELLQEKRDQERKIQ